MAENKQLTFCEYCHFIVFPGKPHIPHPPTDSSGKGYCQVVFDYTPEERAIMLAGYLPIIMDQLK